MRRGWPLAYPGMRIGLLGGTFDPAHAGHRHIADEAMKRLSLDRIWWMATPQNPLKPAAAPLAQRMASARAQARGRRHVVTGIETDLRARYTIETVRALHAAYPGVRFVLLLGEDNLATFARWRSWPALIEEIPIALFARPDGRAGLVVSKPFRRFAAARRAQRDAALLGDAPAPAWCFVAAPLSPLSSTALRAARRQADA
ncbi:MAG: nicotinate-nucleotide adenylyltransferase [Hydrogenophilaceae bacterium]|jgi:nicotinate-nucleotide adenylyltransferase|nr:nicotinate-nucleotide adenylyltransferase [Hydrogenophilaceae bacterium]